MARRVIIVGMFTYPHGDALSNYVQYLADALVASKYNVQILAKLNPEFYKQESCVYHHAKVQEITLKRGNKLFKRLCNGKKGFLFYFMGVICGLKPSSNDVFLTFSGERVRNPIRFMSKIFKYKVVACQLEWFGREQFTLEKQYLTYQKEFEMIHRCDAVFPISYNIAKQFPELPQIIIPPMIDVQEFEKTEKKEGIYNIILPANGMMKDSFSSMIKGFCLLADSELEKVNFHIKGIKKEVIKECVGEDNWKRIKNKIVLHGWMRYEELVSLYNDMHFLILAREQNQMTLSNFPSKVPETMSYGIVPIVSRVGDYTEYYLENGKDSFVFEGCSAEDCCHAYRKALSLNFKIYKNMSQAARKCAEIKFDYRNWIVPIHDTIEKLFV